jgi:hypothetical protein
MSGRLDVDLLRKNLSEMEDCNGAGSASQLLHCGVLRSMKSALGPLRKRGCCPLSNASRRALGSLVWP